MDNNNTPTVTQEPIELLGWDEAIAAGQEAAMRRQETSTEKSLRQIRDILEIMAKTQQEPNMTLERLKMWEEEVKEENPEPSSQVEPPVLFTANQSLEAAMRREETLGLKVDYETVLSQIKDALILIATVVSIDDLKLIRDAATLEEQMKILNRVIYVHTNVDFITIIDNLEDVTHKEVQVTISTLVNNLIIAMNKNQRLYKTIAWVGSLLAAALVLAEVAQTIFS